MCSRVVSVLGAALLLAGCGSSPVAGAVTARQGEFAATTAELRTLGDDIGCDPDEFADGIREQLGCQIVDDR